ncbi:MAG: hypothetical protein OEM63_15055, partial [Gammaproteobacteria bacterium]|nr:hypothetical protein [Gammaproteobacteria bacterium]
MSDPRLDKIDRDFVEEAWKILRSDGGDPASLLVLARELVRKSRFGLARRLLERAREDRDQKIDSPELSLVLRQQHALCTYKDPDLPRHLALDRALRILDHEGDLHRTENQETLGLAGAVYKRKWQVDARKSNLERSLAYYYERGHKAAAKIRADALAGRELPDERTVDLQRVFNGYTSINAAFVLDLLASIEEQEARETGSVATIATERRRQARDVRTELVGSMRQLMERGLVKKSWWFLAALAEAQFGLHDYVAAQESLDDARNQTHEPWMFESTAQQLAKLASIQQQPVSTDENPEKTAAWKTVAGLVGGNDEAVRSLFFGKLGLALSGGGFRASLFHLGVLARLAEQDLLRHVHVLS